MAESKFEKYLIRRPLYERLGGVKNRQSPTMTFMSQKQIPEASCYLEFGWICGIPEPNPSTLEHNHENEEIILFFGGDPENPEDLGGEIEFYIESQPLKFSASAAIYIPPALRHGPIIWKEFRRPHIQMTLSPSSFLSSSNINKVGFQNDNYNQYLVRKPIYERARGIKNRQSPTMTFMSQAQVPEAKYYIEFGWIYGIPEPNPPVTQHVHSNDEVILHFGGDPENPEELGGEIEIMVEDDSLVFDTSTALFAPRGLRHCPVTWRKWRKPHIEMAITLGSGQR